MSYTSTKVIELGSCAFRQWKATHSHCSKVHGYQLKAKFWFGCNSLDERNWSVDFGGLKELKDILQKQFDHTLCVAKDDPFLESFKTLHTQGVVDLRIVDAVGIEKAAEFCYDEASKFVDKIHGDRVWVEKVEVFEHEDNSAIFSPKNDRVVSVGVQDTPSIDICVPPIEDLSIPLPITAIDSPSHPHKSSNSVPARVGSNVSTGKGDWFKGTTWG